MPSLPGANSATVVNIGGKGRSERILIQELQTDWTYAVEARLNHLCQLPINWNGYGAKPVKFSTASFAMQMLRSICPCDASVPSIVPGVNGDLQIEWHLDGGDIELHVRLPNDVHAFRETPETGEEGEERELNIDFTEVTRWVKELMDSAHAPVRTAA